MKQRKKHEIFTLGRSSGSSLERLLIYVTSSTVNSQLFGHSSFVIIIKWLKLLSFWVKKLLMFWSPSALTKGVIFFALSCFGNSMILLLWRLFLELNLCWGLAQKIYFCSGTQMIKKNWAISFIGSAEYSCFSSKNRRPESCLKLATLSDPFFTKRLIQQRQQQQHPSLRCRTDFVWKGCALVEEKCRRSNMKTKYGQVKPFAGIPFFQMKSHNQNAPGLPHQETAQKGKGTTLKDFIWNCAFKRITPPPPVQLIYTWKSLQWNEAVRDPCRLDGSNNGRGMRYMLVWWHTIRIKVF